MFRLCVSELFPFQFQFVYWLFCYDLKHTVRTHTLGLERKINIFNKFF
jgi:hypothetical protein